MFRHVRNGNIPGSRNNNRDVAACSMKLTQDIRAAAEAGMSEKAREFLEAGGEIYATPRVTHP